MSTTIGWDIGGAHLKAARAEGGHAQAIASANWRASAEAAALHVRDAILLDIGSTTTDLIPIVAGAVAAVGADDAGRLAAGELVYTGLTRSFVMAMAARAPF